MAQRITKGHIRQWLVEGRGSGHGSAYTPWIKITTRGSPGWGNLQFRFLPELGRYGHLLSAGELHVLRFLLYLGVEDVREQFPCWPWPYPHPLYLHPNFNPLRSVWSSGTIAIAKRLGIKHPVFPKTNLYYVPTIDILATVHSQPDCRAVAFAVKLDPDEVELDERDAEKLAIQAAYCEELNIPWHLISAKKIPETLRENLRVLIQYSAPKPVLDELLVKFSAHMIPKLLASDAIASCIQGVSTQLGVSENLSEELFHRAMWFRSIPIDIREPWVMSEPARLCDLSWIEAARNHLLGGTAND